MAFLDFSKLSNVGIVPYLTVIFVTLVTTYPFFAIIDDLSSKNGQNITYHSLDFKENLVNPVTWLFKICGLTLIGPLSYINSITWGKQLYKSPVFDASHGDRQHDYCDAMDMRSKIENHLTEAISKTLYIVGLLGWCLVKILHDVFLLSGLLAEKWSLSLGIVSHVFQWMATLAGLAWSAGAVEVFVAEIDGTQSACYYQLGGFDSLIALALPLPLLYTSFTKLASLFRAIQFGDHLFAVQYDVPHRIVKTTLGKHATSSLLVASVAGSDTAQAAPIQELSCADFLRLMRCLEWISSFQLWYIILVLLPLVAGPMLVKAVQHASLATPIVLTTCASSLAGLYVMLSTIWKLHPKWYDVRGIVHTVAFTGLYALPAIACQQTLMAVVHLPDTEALLHQAWLVCACSYVTGFLGYVFFSFSGCGLVNLWSEVKYRSAGYRAGLPHPKDSFFELHLAQALRLAPYVEDHPELHLGPLLKNEQMLPLEDETLHMQPLEDLLKKRCTAPTEPPAADAPGERQALLLP